MSIPSQLPQFVTAARPGALQALALQSGQVLDARVVGAAANGLTQVEIRGQLLNLMLPTPSKAGETIRLEVQGAGTQLRLALLSAIGPAAAPLQPTPATAPVIVALSQPSPAPMAQPGNVVPPPATVGPQPSAQPVTQSGAVPPLPSAPSTQALPSAATRPASIPPVSQTATPAPITQPVAQAAGARTSTPAAPIPVATYPQAAMPAPPNPLAAAAAATATAPPQPATPSAIAGPVRPVVATTVTANATAHAPPGNTAPPPPAPQPATPQSALAQMVQASVPRQGSITALTTALSAIAGRVVLPEPVARAAQQVLAGRVTIDGARFDGTALQAAMRGSGVFQEANLARGQGLTQPDMKSALLTLRNTLTAWLGQQAPVAPVAQIPPPLRGSIPRARGNEAPPLDPNAAPDEIGRQLLERTESALARVRLHQHASLPDPTGRTADLSLDLPVMVGAHQTLMQLQIHRDQHNEAENAAERGWQLRFALNLPDMGEVGAQVTLRAGSIGVMLWATEPVSSVALEAEIGALRETLAAAGLQPGAVLVRHGEPPAAPTAPSGHFVDSRR